ncbi:hypothetical protein GCM10010994_05560 [Chelatococcus reniformis]|uniref:Uncharacterized protein n=1 Tax=Chelatococcus reniformis TaxID=1494448 RepID=A0A916X703_9HYPH|nr:hypothetical protein GCM10010994_05560 [Chelatococcus reniformis]
MGKRCGFRRGLGAETALSQRARDRLADLRHQLIELLTRHSWRRLGGANRDGMEQKHKQKDKPRARGGPAMASGCRKISPRRWTAHPRLIPGPPRARPRAIDNAQQPRSCLCHAADQGK